MGLCEVGIFNKQWISHQAQISCTPIVVLWAPDLCFNLLFVPDSENEMVWFTISAGNVHDVAKIKIKRIVSIPWAEEYELNYISTFLGQKFAKQGFHYFFCNRIEEQSRSLASSSYCKQQKAISVRIPIIVPKVSGWFVMILTTINNWIVMWPRNKASGPEFIYKNPSNISITIFQIFVFSWHGQTHLIDFQFSSHHEKNERLRPVVAKSGPAQPGLDMWAVSPTSLKNVSNSFQNASQTFVRRHFFLFFFKAKAKAKFLMLEISTVGICKNHHHHKKVWAWVTSWRLLFIKNLFIV